MHDFQKQLNDTGTLEIPQGVHTLDDPLEVPSGGAVRGSGPACLLKFPGVTSGPCIINQHWRDSEPGDTGITLRDFSIEGAGDGLPSGPVQSFSQGVRLQKVTGFTVSGVRVSRTGFGIFGVGCTDGAVSGCHVTGTGRDGIHFVAYLCETVEKFDRRDTRNIVITGNRVVATGDDCIAVHCGAESNRNQNTTSPPSGFVITDNFVGSHLEHPKAQGRGVILTGVHDSIVAGNHIADTVSCGLWLQEDHHSGVPQGDKLKCERIIVTGNTLRNAGQVQGMGKPSHAIRLIGIDQCRITGNSSENHKDRLIRAERIGTTEWGGNLSDVPMTRIEIQQ